MSIRLRLSISVFAIMAMGQGISGYVVTDLPAHGWSYSSAAAISEKDEIVGTVALPDSWAVSYMAGFLWRRGSSTTLENIDMPGANDINVHSEVVGGPLIWRKGTFQYLGDLGGHYSVANSINNRSEVAGFSYLHVGSDGTHAFVWRDGKITDLGPEGYNSVANCISDSGLIVGARENDGWWRATLWRQGELVDIGAPPALSYSWAAGVNNRGQVVGMTGGDGIPTRGFLWERGVMSALPPLPGFPYCIAKAINNRGQIVGYSFTDDPVSAIATIWLNGVPQALTSAGAKYSVARDINDRGHVVGFHGKLVRGSIRESAALWKPGRL